MTADSSLAASSALAEARLHLARGRPERALSIAHPLTAPVRIEPRHRLAALDLVSRACRELEQPLFAGALAIEASALRETLGAKATPSAFDEAERSEADAAASELLRCLCLGWHRLGVPLLPQLGGLRLAGTQLVNEPRARIGSMSWWCPLPLRLPDGEQPVALATVFDFTVEGARATYARVASGASAGPALTALCAESTSRLGVVSRVPSEIVASVRHAGEPLRATGVPADRCPIVPASERAERWLAVADDLVALGAPLLAMALFEGAAARFDREGDPEGATLARARRALARQSIDAAPAE